MTPPGRETSLYGTEFGPVEGEPPSGAKPANARSPARTRVERELAILELARRQHDVVSLAELESLGLSARAVRGRVAQQRHQRVNQGVYALPSTALSFETRCMAAVLACGPGAAVSHRSAADLHGLRSSHRTLVDVTVPRRSGRARPGIDIHRPVNLLARDLTRVEGITCTSVARTLVELAGTIDRHALERAVERAEMLRVFDLNAVEDVLERAGRRPGVRSLRAVLAVYAPDPAFTRSELERRFLALCLQAGVPRPRVNTFTALERDGLEVDFSWPDRRLIVEADSHRYHGTRRAFERDRRRDQQLTVEGWRVVRFTWRQVFREPAVVGATVRALLGADLRESAR